MPDADGTRYGSVPNQERRGAAPWPLPPEDAQARLMTRECKSTHQRLGFCFPTLQYRVTGFYLGAGLLALKSAARGPDIRPAPSRPARGRDKDPPHPSSELRDLHTLGGGIPIPQNHWSFRPCKAVGINSSSEWTRVFPLACCFVPCLASFSFNVPLLSVCWS